MDLVLDVRRGLPFENVRLIFAEHFIEHLSLAEALAFLRECRRILDAHGTLRLSTPNLDWVWLTHYKQPALLTEEERLLGCLEINRAFHGWGHQFLWNLHTLSMALEASGFTTVVPRSYGDSSNPDLRGLERHERHGDLPDAPSVIVIEASGTRDRTTMFDEIIQPYVRDAATK